MSEVRLYGEIRPIGPTGSIMFSKSGTPNGVQWRLPNQNDIYSAFAITSFTVSPSAVLCGTGLVNPIFNITYNYPASGAYITVGTGRVDLVAPYTSVTGNFNLGTGVFASGHTFTLVASGQFGTATSTVRSTYMQPYYWGRSFIESSTIDSAFIMALSTGFLATGFAHFPTGSFSLTSDRYLYFAWRNSTLISGIPTPEFIDLATNIGSQLSYYTDFNFTNQAGYVDKYIVYRTDYPDLLNIKFGIRNAY